MNIAVPDYVTDARPDGLGFSRMRVEKLINKHDQTHDVVYGEMSARIYAKFSANFVDIAVTARPHGKWQVVFAYRVFSDLIAQPIADMSPLAIVEEMARRFGRDLTVGGSKTGRFFLKETIPISDDRPHRLFMVPHDKPADSYIIPALVLENADSIDVALVFCLDLIRYAHWHESHGRLDR